ncbi:unnamed protein product [Rotaria sp. Silwood2]|nr:unnamed protein product [Rotaria sp. Silwood2]
MNENLLVQAKNDNDPATFFIQFAPYNSTKTSLQCSILYPDILHHYVYTVAVAQKQKNNQTHFFFAGEFINGQRGTFVGIARYQSTTLIANSSLDASSFCDESFSYSLQYLSNYEHQEYFVLGVEPEGILSYGFSNQFVFIFDSRNTSILQSWNGNLTWPDHSFMPHAIALSDHFGVIAGFIQNTADTLVKHSPMIYLINFNSSNHHPIIVDQYKPIATPGTWQDLLTNDDADINLAKYDMSVSINENGDVLVGMQFINRVFLFSVNTAKSNKLTYVSRHTNGRSLGNGKGVAWLENGAIAAILVNTYSLNYQWSSSKLYVYDIRSFGFNSNSTPLSVFPNGHLMLPQRFSSVFLNIISSPTSLALLDDKGNVLIFLPTPPGFYPSIQDSGLMPVITTQSPCMPGTYKSETGIHDCILCPSGTKNFGNSTTQCTRCLSKSFCSLGSVHDVPQSALISTSQVIPYPRSPESTIFDEILIQNMFRIESGHCLAISPLFWTLIVASLAIIVLIIMAILELFISNPTATKIRRLVKHVFKHTDFIGEGELWVGGLVSLAVVVLVSFAYAFSNVYSKQYPIETASDSNFACDKTIRNAKFETSLQSLGIPHAQSEQHIFDLLHEQELYLNIEFVNTLINCDSVSMQALFGTSWAAIRWLTCQNVNSILALSIPLPYQHISVQILIDDVKTIGGLRIGLYGHGNESEHYRLKELNFYQSFSKIGQILAQNLPIALALTKLINETLPMVGEESKLSGIFIPTFTADFNSLFLSNDQYVRSSIGSTTPTIEINETPYYVKNLQQPIAKQSEIIFHNLLFTIVCLEIFGLVFLFFKLILKPLYYYCFGTKMTKYEEKYVNTEITNVNLIELGSLSRDKTDESNTVYSF